MASDALLRLIGTMNSQEKRYFKLYSSFYHKQNGKSSLKLFDLIDKINPVSGRALADMVQNQPFVHRLAFVKNQLTEHLLDSLSSYHASGNSRSVLQRLLTHIDTLINRGLYDHAGRLLVRAEKKAIKTEEHLWLLEILNRKRVLLLRQVTPDFEKDIHAFYARTRETLELLLSTSRYNELMDLTQLLAARYATTPTPEDRQKLSVLMQNQPLQNTTQELPFNAQIALCSARGTYALLNSDLEQAIGNFHSIVQLWRKRPEMIEEQTARYRRYLLNYLSCLVSTDDEEEFVSAIGEAKHLCSNESGDQAYLKDIWNLELLFYMNRGNLERCADAIRSMEQYMKLHKVTIDPATYITLCHNCSVYYFLEGKYREALGYINTIGSETRIELKKDVQTFSRIFNLIAHYELQNTDLLDHLLRSTKRYLKKNSILVQFEHIIIQGIRALLGAINTAARQKVYKSIHTKLLSLQESQNQDTLGLLESLLWTESKLRQMSIRQLLALKTQEHKTVSSKD